MKKFEICIVILSNENIEELSVQIWLGPLSLPVHRVLVKRNREKHTLKVGLTKSFCNKYALLHTPGYLHAKLYPPMVVILKELGET